MEPQDASSAKCHEQLVLDDVVIFGHLILVDSLLQTMFHPAPISASNETLVHRLLRLTHSICEMLEIS